MWGKILFAILSGFGVVICILGKAMNMALFFVIVCAVTMWLISREKRRNNNVPRTR